MFTKQKRALPVLCAVLAIAVFAAYAGNAAAVSQAQINALKKQQEAIAAQKETISEKMSAAESELTSSIEQKTALDEQNTLTMQEIELINEQIALYEDLVEQKAKELTKAEQAEQEQAASLRVRMRAMEENGSLSYISILFNATSFTDFLAKLADIDAMMKSDKALEDAYIAARELVEQVKAEYEQTLEDQKATKLELEEKKSELELQIAAAEEIIKALEADYESYKAEFEASAANEEALNSQICQLITELENQQKQNGGIITGTGTYIWPLPGYAASGNYGNRYHPILKYWRFHYGEDIGAPSGTPILAADSGTVAVAAYEAGGYGNYIVLNHGDGRSTRYAHMSAFAVSAGQSVTQGQVIGYVGSTGLSTDAHLHFETRVNGTAVDPKSYF
ncbi:MAG: peptidase M23 [Clostridia bacterium]|nr:peptidase M23 [Clostridia bacterium]